MFDKTNENLGCFQPLKFIENNTYSYLIYYFEYMIAESKALFVCSEMIFMGNVHVFLSFLNFNRKLFQFFTKLQTLSQISQEIATFLPCPSTPQVIIILIIAH